MMEIGDEAEHGCGIFWGLRFTVSSEVGRGSRTNAVVACGSMCNKMLEGMRRCRLRYCVRGCVFEICHL